MNQQRNYAKGEFQPMTSEQVTDCIDDVEAFMDRKYLAAGDKCASFHSFLDSRRFVRFGTDEELEQ